MHEPFIYRLVPTLVDMMGSVYPELQQRARHVGHVIQAEEESFLRTLERGVDIFEADVAELKITKQTQFSGEKAFRLYDTYGFPLDLTQLMAQERNLTVDTAAFGKLMEEQRARARAAQKDVEYEADALGQQLPVTDDSAKYQMGSLKSRIIGFVQDSEFVTEGVIPPGAKVGIVLERTCAYAEAGGQVGDKGIITCGDQTFQFDDTIHIGSAVVHLGNTEAVELAIGSEVIITIGPERQDTRRNHTATHLLQWALQKVLGSHAHQEGSLVCPEYLRFDFTHPRALTAEQIEEVEKLVREKIQAARPVQAKVLPMEQAKQLGAMALFSEKYGDEVRVLAIGAENPDHLDNAFSREFCGGTHVENTNDIGGFKITREESVATGVRRITAQTGRALHDMLYQHSLQVNELTTLLKTTPEQLIDRVKSLWEENKKLKKQLKKGSAGDLKAAAQKLLDQAESVGASKIIIGEIPGAPVEAIRMQIDRLRKKAPSSATVLASAAEEGKVLLFAAVTNDLIDSKGLKAGDIVKEIAPLVGGGGGGRPQMAQAGGKDASKIGEALAAAQNFIKDKL